MHTWLTGFLAVICISVVLPTYAIDDIAIQLDAFDAEQFSGNNIDVDLKLTTQGLALSAQLKQLVLPEPVGKLSNVDFSCKSVSILADNIDCKQGTLSFSHKELGRQVLSTTLTVQPDAKQYAIAIDTFTFADAQFSIKLHLTHNQWQLHVQSDSIDLAKLNTAIQTYLSEDMIQQLATWQLEAVSDVQFDAVGFEDKLQTAQLKADVTNLSVSDEKGMFVTDAVNTQLELDLRNDNQTWFYKADVKFANGQAYAEPIFIDFKQTPINIKASGNVDQNGVITNKSDIEQFNVVNATITYQGTTDLSGEMSLTTNKSELTAIYTHWLQPFLLESAWTDMELAGEVALALKKHKQDQVVSVEFADVYVDDQQGRFGIDKLNGQLSWSSFTQQVETALSWQGGHVYALPYGQSQINAISYENQFKLTKDWQLPLLDGALQLNNFQFNYNREDDSTWSFDGLITPISMGELSAALEWPLMRGKLSGVIPNVSYQNHQITLDGALMVKVFDGTTVIRDLRLTDPFGSLPSLEANLDVNLLDLETLTSTFDFGKITGKLNGYVHQLRMANWQPVAFNAKFYTPEEDKSRRRISQQAVNSLSQVSGGGASALLSRSFLRFFEDFSYKRLGLSCTLANEVCEMDGVKPAEQGYYIVEGGGLPPRINVVGYTRRVNWPDLIERLKSVTNSEGPIIE